MDACRTTKYSGYGREMTECGGRIQAVPSKGGYEVKGRSKGADKSDRG